MKDVNATVVAAAGGAIAIATLDLLIEKGLLTRDEAVNLVSRAIQQVSRSRGSELIDTNQFLSNIARKFVD